MAEKTYGYRLDPLIDRTAPLKLAESTCIVLHKVKIKLADELVVIRLLLEDRMYNTHKQRAAVLEEELLRGLLVTHNKPVYEGWGRHECYLWNNLLDSLIFLEPLL